MRRNCSASRCKWKLSALFAHWWWLWYNCLSSLKSIKECSTWNTLKTKNPQKSKFADFFIFQKKSKKNQKSLDFLNFWRGGASANVKRFLPMLPKNVWPNYPQLVESFFSIGLTNWRGGASSSTTMICVGCSAPIIQCANELVKSFLWPRAYSSNYFPIAQKGAETQC